MAIARDAVSVGAGSATTTATWSHTCSGKQRLLIVTVRSNLTKGVINSVTYNSVAMTFIAKEHDGGINYIEMWYLLAPATGANNVVVTSSASDMIDHGEAISYTGVRQKSQPDSSATKQQIDQDSMTATTTVVNENCWTVLSEYGPDATAGSGSYDPGGGIVYTFDSNGTVATGSVSMTVTGGDGNSDWCGVIASFSPYEPKGGSFIYNLI